jgi:hypothetical protein
MHQRGVNTISSVIFQCHLRQARNIYTNGRVLERHVALAQKEFPATQASACIVTVFGGEQEHTWQLALSFKVLGVLSSLPLAGKLEYITMLQNGQVFLSEAERYSNPFARGQLALWLIFAMVARGHHE